jgi:hypothetical protein
VVKQGATLEVGVGAMVAVAVGVTTGAAQLPRRKTTATTINKEMEAHLKVP